MDDQGIGKEALGSATEAMPSIHLVLPWPPDIQGQFSVQTVDADINVVMLKT